MNAKNQKASSAHVMYSKGYDACEALKEGDTFKGAWGHAEDEGLKKGSIDHTNFTAGFLSAVSSRDILVDSNDEIVEIIPIH